MREGGKEEKIKSNGFTLLVLKMATLEKGAFNFQLAVTFSKIRLELYHHMLGTPQ